MLVVIGSFLIIQGIPGGHEWYEETFVHLTWNNLVSITPIPAEFHMNPHSHEESIFTITQVQAGIIFAMLIITPIIWYSIKKIKSSRVLK